MRRAICVTYVSWKKMYVTIGTHLQLVGVTFPAIWEIAPRLRACRADHCALARVIHSRPIRDVPLAGTFDHLDMAPLTNHAHESGVAVLRKGEDISL